VNKIKIQVSKIQDNLFQVTASDSEVTHGLSATDYDEFSAVKEFAGLSKRGFLMCKPGSTGQPEISGYPIIPNPDDTWCNCSETSPLVKTNEPECAVSIRSNSWAKPYLLVKQANLIDRYEVMEYLHHHDKDSEVVHVITEDINKALDFRARHSVITLGHNRNTFYILFPRKYVMSASDWKLLGRHIFTGQATAEYKDTVPLQNSNSFWVPGSVLATVEQHFGIQGIPVAYKEGYLGFSEIKILSPNKAVKLNSVLSKLKTVHCNFGGYHGSLLVSMSDVVQNPKLCERPLSTDNQFQQVRVTAEQVCPLLDYPLLGSVSKDEDTLALVLAEGTSINYTRQTPGSQTIKFCNQFFVPLAKATRTHKLSDEIIRYTLCFGQRSLMPGKWILKSALIHQPLRDGKVERKAKQTRIQQLEAKYGPIPKGLHLKKDEEVAQFFKIQAQLQKGEIILITESSLLPDYFSHLTTFKTWLAGQGHISTCPVTNQEYITNFQNLDQVIQLPNFLATLKEAFGEEEWLVKLLASPTAQALAITHLL
jgi:hypothetical protein